MYKTISSRLTAHFNPKATHLHLYLQNRPAINKSLCEDLILQDQVLVPTSDFLTACGLVLLVGETAFVELLERNRLKFIRARGGITFLSGKGPAELGVFHSSNDEKPQDSALEESLAAGLAVIESRLADKRKLHELILQNTHPVEWSSLLEAVKRESMLDLRQTAVWRPEYETDDPTVIRLPKTEKIIGRVVGPDFDPTVKVEDAALALALYNSDFYLANQFECQDISPYYPVGDLLAIKARRLKKAVDTPEKLWNLFEIDGVPDFSGVDLAHGSYMKTFINATEGRNAAAFREWFHSKRDLTEVELLREYMSVLRQTPWIERLPAKVLRFAASVAVGVVPIADQLLSVFDAFVVDRLFRGTSPKYFVDDLTQVTRGMSLHEQAGN